VTNYHSQFLENIKQEMDAMEHIIHKEIREISKLQLEDEFMDSVLDPCFSRSRNTKVFKLIELYWLNKAFVAQVIEGKK
jgi:hypothetical protein